jgi:hypothetical protein
MIDNQFPPHDELVKGCQVGFHSSYKCEDLA